jgi:hypothetical protein
MFDEEDQQLISEFGMEGFDEAVVGDLLAQYYETLQLRVAMAIEDKLSDEQLAEFENLHDAGDDAAAGKWLKTAVSDYDKIVADETTAVKADIKRTLASIHKATEEK